MADEENMVQRLARLRREEQEQIALERRELRERETAHFKKMSELRSKGMAAQRAAWKEGWKK